MTTYRIPTLPDVPFVWLLDHPVYGPGPHRCTRVGATTSWCLEIANLIMQGDELLALGEVSDVHPHVPVDDPLPWTYEDDEFLDADGQLIRVHSSGLPDLIVAAVNAYGERIAGGWANDADRAIEQARAAHDEAEVEITRLNVELSDVLGEVRRQHHGASHDVRYAAREALRARLGGA